MEAGMAHYKRKRPRTKDLGVSDYKHMARRLGGKDNMHKLYSSCSSGHNMMFHIRPTRRKQRRLEKSILRGADPDGIAWPLGKKPHSYYW
jgi:hypothetical protein